VGITLTKSGSELSDLTPVVSYARISSDTTKDAHGVQDQHKVNRETAARFGCAVVHEFTDNDRSASKVGVVREDFEAMLRVVRAGQLPDGRPVRGVVVLADDRLARQSGDYERFVNALTGREGRVYMDARGRKDLYSEDVEGMGLVGVAFSKIEARKIKRRLRRSHRARAELGIPVGGNRPFGWQDDRLALHPDEAPLLKAAIEDFAAGASLNSIVSRWNKKGVRTTLGNEWTTRSLRVTIGNPRSCGQRRHGGEIVRDASGSPVVGTWEALVPESVWLAVDARLNARRGRTVGRDGEVGQALAVDFREHRYLLTGVLRCGKPREDGSPCNARLRVSRQRDCTQHLYTCPTKGQGGCGGLGRRGDRVDEYVTEAVLAKLEQRQAHRPDDGPWRGEAEIRRIQEKLTTLRRQWQADQVSDQLFFTTVGELEGRLRELGNERGRYELAARRALVDTEDIRRRWFADPDDGGLDLPQKRAYIQEALHAVIVKPAGKGNGSRGTFDPALLVPIWRE
jgi:DNA invertase Pin-like site-specific DNA recombinase